MKPCILFLVYCLSFLNSHSQTSVIEKPVIDTSILDKWPELSNGKISNDGKYIAYTILEKMPVEKQITTIKSTTSEWRKSITGVAALEFTSNSRNAVFSKGESICIIGLGTKDYRFLATANQFTLVHNGNGDWLVYQNAKGNREMVIRNLNNEKTQVFSNVNQYLFSKDGGNMIIESEDGSNCSLELINVSKGDKTEIWTGIGARVVQTLFNANGTGIAFLIENKGSRSIWFYRMGEAKAVNVTKEQVAGDFNNLHIQTLDHFTKDGTRLFIKLAEDQKVAKKSNPSLANVNIWDYRDNMLQSDQLNRLKGNRTLKSEYLAVLDILNANIIRLQNEGDEVFRIVDDFCLLRSSDIDPSKITSFNSSLRNSVLYLESTKDGHRQQLPWNHKRILNSYFSPANKFIIYWESPELNYFSYEIATGITRNITEGIKANMMVDDGYINKPKETRSLIPLAGWLKDDAGVFIYDRNDIWLVDPFARHSPENITNGYGQKNGLLIRFGLKKYETITFQSGDKVFLAAFNYRTKENGYLEKIIGQKGDPKLLNMESALYAYSFNPGVSSNKWVNYPLESENGKAFLLRKQTASDYPNYYWTADFKSFRKLSDLQPEKKWNWLTSELHTWVAPDGDTLQGILYKPENFDASKKYPVLFSYYRQFSDQYNEYHMPAWSTSRLDIPWYVSNGYLVFMPDIHYRIPELRSSVLNCLTSAADYISKLAFVDSSKMGVQGHSFGGLETGYLVTGTNKFAAACTAAGYFDLISDVGSLAGTGTHRNITEDHMGGTLWERPQEYMKNSTIFYLDKVNTPVLIVTGRLDSQVPHAQRLELYLGLRRLGKVAWMLDYEDENHGFYSGSKSSKDYTFRLTQFYDHYLKTKPAPKWMTKGVPASLKGIDNGYESDPGGKCSIYCKICNKHEVAR